MNSDDIIIYCDGACSGNQFRRNVGGWGAVIKYRDKTQEIFGGEKNTTNQRMELTACLKALEQVESNGAPIEVFSDSAYLVNCMTRKWYAKWQVNGWRNSQKEPVENQDLWQSLLAFIKQHKVSFHKVSGHSGVGLNETADRLARRGIAASG